MDWTTLSVVALAIGAGSIVKGATGIGLPLIAVPFMATLLGLHHAIAVMIVPVLVSNIWQLAEFRAQRSDGRLGFLTPMIAAAVVGVVLGTILLSITPERILGTVLGLTLFGYLALRLAKPAFRLEPAAARRLAIPVGLLSGGLHGAAGVSAPISVPFVHAMQLGRPGQVFAISAVFLALALVQLPSLYLVGIMRAEWIVHGFLAVLPMLLFMPVGQWLGARLSAQAFDRVVLAFLGLMGIKLVAQI